MNRRVLVVSYYWFPAEGTGIYRISRFVKYLQQKGWEPIVLTAATSAGTFQDTAPSTEFARVKVYRSSIWEPLSIFKALTGKKGQRQKGDVLQTLYMRKDISWKEKLAAWVRFNLFLPDAKKFWRKPAVDLGKKLIKEWKPDLIFSTSPPPTTSLIAHDLAKWSGLPWVADFRDPWTRIYYLEGAPQMKWAKRKNASLERRCLQRATAVTTVSSGFFEGQANDKFTMLPNGFDPADYPAKTSMDKNRFVVRYFGQWKDNQQAEAFFKALQKLAQKNTCPKLSIETFGTCSHAISQRLKAISELLPVTINPFVPKKEAVNLMMQSGILLMVIGKSKMARHILSTKIFDYLYAERPILGFGPPEGEAAKVLLQTGRGVMLPHEGTDRAIAFIEKQYRQWEKGELPKFDKEVDQFRFEQLTDQLIQVFENALQ